MRRRASSVMSHAAMIKLFQKHRNIKYLENGLHRHATHVFLKYTSTGGYAKNPIVDRRRFFDDLHVLTLSAAAAHGGDGRRRFHQQPLLECGIAPGARDDLGIIARAN